MMNKIIIYIILIVLFSTDAFPKRYLKEGLPLNPIIINSADLNKSYIKAQIKEFKDKKYQFKEKETIPLQKQIANNNNKIFLQIRSVKVKIKSLFQQKSNLEKNNDISKLEKNIIEKKKTIINIKSQLEKVLQDIKYSGLYLIAVKQDYTYEDNEKLSQKARELIAPQAIEDLIGIYMNSYSDIKNYETVKDKIEATTSGKIEIEEKYIGDSYRTSDIFLYLAKVNVAPLKNKIEIDKSQTLEVKVKDYKIFNLVQKRINLVQKLKEFGLDDEIIKNDKIIKIINSIIEIKTSVIKNENDLAEKNVKSILKEYLGLIKNIENEIIDVTTQIQVKKNILKNLYEEISFNSEDYTLTGINRAHRIINSKILALRDNIVLLKNEELKHKFKNVNVDFKTVSNIADKTIELYQEIENDYGTVDKLFRKDEVENFMLINQEEKRKSEYYRKINNIWIYIMPLDYANMYKIGIVANFKISESKIKPLVHNSHKKKYYSNRIKPHEMSPTYIWYKIKRMIKYLFDFTLVASIFFIIYTRFKIEIHKRKKYYFICSILVLITLAYNLYFSYC